MTSIGDLLPNLCDVEMTMTSYAADRVRGLATPRRLIVELGNGSSGPSRSVPALSRSAVLEDVGDRISEVFSQVLSLLDTIWYTPI